MVHGSEHHIRAQGQASVLKARVDMDVISLCCLPVLPPAGNFGELK